MKELTSKNSLLKILAVLVTGVVLWSLSPGPAGLEEGYGILSLLPAAVAIVLAFLIRNVLGVDPQAGILSVGEILSVGRSVQIHLRDGDASAQDLRAMLRNRARPGRPRGALLFSCLGRGQGLYGRPNHDTELFRDKLGSVPLGGFFCNGEIGPVSGTTFLHGYTSSFGIFRASV